jgi:hypothetical protein
VAGLDIKLASAGVAGVFLTGWECPTLGLGKGLLLPRGNGERFSALPEVYAPGLL